MRNAEQFAAEEIAIIPQLAYADPIRLTARTGLSYSYVVDRTYRYDVLVKTHGAKAAIQPKVAAAEKLVGVFPTAAAQGAEKKPKPDERGRKVPASALRDDKKSPYDDCALQGYDVLLSPSPEKALNHRRS